MPDFGQGGGYIDLIGFGITPNPNLEGDTIKGSFSSAVTFLGETFNGFTVTDDGFITFGPTVGDSPWVNQNLPSATQPNYLIAPYWRDMQVTVNSTPGEESGISVATAGSAYTIVEFDNMLTVYTAGGQPIGDIADFEVVFNNTGAGPEIMVAYDNVTHQYGDVIPTTIGYEDKTGQSGTAAVYRPYWGVDDEPVGTVADIQSGTIMCYNLVPVPADPVELTFQAKVVDDFAGGTLNVALNHDVNSTGAVAVDTTAAVEVEGPVVASFSGPASVTEGDTISYSIDASDPNGDAITYSWKQLSGPAMSVDTTASAISFKAPEVANALDLVMTFEVTVSSSDGSQVKHVFTTKVKDKSDGGSMGYLLILLAPLAWLRRRRG